MFLSPETLWEKETWILQMLPKGLLIPPRVKGMEEERRVAESKKGVRRVRK